MSESDKSGFQGLLRLFVYHRTAGHILMILMVGLGLYGFSNLNIQFFPTVSVNMVNISILWPGADSENVDEAIVAAVEPAVRFLDGVREVTSTARNGVATIAVEFRRGSDMQKAVADVESALEGVATLPLDSERPRVAQASFHESVASLLLSGNYSELQLKQYAKQARDELLARGVDKINIQGARDEEILVEIRPDSLRRYGLTHQQVAARIADSSLDMPGGVLRGSTERQVRASALALSADQVGQIDLRRMASGDNLLLRDVADVKEGFDAAQPTGWRGSTRAIRLTVQRSETSDALEMAEHVRGWLADAPGRYPADLTIQLVDVRADRIVQRINVLLKNGAGGMVLVLGLLFLFLKPRVAIWVAIGIPVALIAALGVMWPLDRTINMLSMFALIMTIGIIVDDTIVVGEHVVSLHEQGQAAGDAAVNGARRMMAPIIAAALTTLAAFLPMLIIDNTFGDIVRPIPYVVLAVLIASLLECFLVLPHHMKLALTPSESRWRMPRFYQSLRAKQEQFGAWFETFRAGKFRRWIEAAFARRYEVVASALASLMIAIGLLVSGWLGFSFFPSPEAEVIEAHLYFHPGTPRSRTQEGLAALEASLYATEKELQAPLSRRRWFGLLPPKPVSPLVYGVFGELGKAGSSTGDYRAQLWVELTPSENRDIRTPVIEAAWRKNLPKLSGISNIRILAQRPGPPGDDIEIRLEGATPLNLKSAAEELKAYLSAFAGVTAARDNLFYDKQSLLMSITPYGTALGFDNQLLGQQLRHGLYGAIAKRFARADEEVKIRVSLPQNMDGNSFVDSLESLDVLVPNSTPPQYVPLSSLVEVKDEPSFTAIRRINGKRSVRVMANYDSAAGDLNSIMARLRTEFLPQLTAKYDITWSSGGRNADQAETIGRLRMGVLLALGLIYVILAFVFSSFSRPGLIMAIIPFGLVGAVFGHFIQGFNFTFLSLIGLLGLSGILVNNSIILIARMEERLRTSNKDNIREAILGAVQDRLRPVILTSGTTVLGLLPLLFETSLQAQFLLPMVITIAWGLAVASFLVLFLVPALLGIGEDRRRARLQRSQKPRPQLAE